jgi:hypothetical protein
MTLQSPPKAMTLEAGDCDATAVPESLLACKQFQIRKSKHSDISPTDDSGDAVPDRLGISRPLLPAELLKRPLKAGLIVSYWQPD